MELSDNMKRIYLSPPHLCGREMEFVQAAFASNWIAPAGPALDAFEKSICEKTGARHCVALQSGTAALHIALLVLGVQRDDLVIISNFTFPASANPILYVGATPVFVDVETETWNIDPELLLHAIEVCLKKNNKPKAIIVPHIYGMPAKMNEIMQIADRFQIPVIEDAAESFGSLYQQKHTGTFGTLGVFSFNGNKIITTSGGGALVSDNGAYIEKAKFLATQARDKATFYEHSQVGYNYRLSNICAAIGLGQLTVLEERIQQRRKIYETYKNKLSANSEITLQYEPTGHYSNRWLTTILVKPLPLGAPTNERIRTLLEQDAIEARMLWKPLHQQPVLKNYPAFINGNANALFTSGLALPSGSALTEADIDRVIRCIEQK
jgi:dTDP-4-amino-4,6-dideoxygalactose transaminase